MNHGRNDLISLTEYPSWLIFCPFRLATKMNICHETEHYPCAEKSEILVNFG